MNGYSAEPTCLGEATEVMETSWVHSNLFRMPINWFQTCLEKENALVAKAQSVSSVLAPNLEKVAFVLAEGDFKSPPLRILSKNASPHTT